MPSFQLPPSHLYPALINTSVNLAAPPLRIRIGDIGVFLFFKLTVEGCGEGAGRGGGGKICHGHVWQAVACVAGRMMTPTPHHHRVSLLAGRWT